MSHVMRHVSHISCLLSGVRCHMSGVTCHLGPSLSSLCPSPKIIEDVVFLILFLQNKQRGPHEKLTISIFLLRVTSSFQQLLNFVYHITQFNLLYIHPYIPFLLLIAILQSNSQYEAFDCSVCQLIWRKHRSQQGWGENGLSLGNN